MNKKLRTILISTPFKLVVGLAVGLTATYFLLAYFAVNPIAKRVLPWVAEHELASRMAVDQVKFDPLRLVLTVDNLRLSRPDGGELARLAHLSVDLEADGMLRLAWHVKNIRLTGPHANLNIGPDGRLNWADLIAKLNEEEEPEEETIPRVVIDHLLIERGSLHYAERNRPLPYTTELTPLGLELDGFSTLPQDRGDYLIVAKMPNDGATIKWNGKFGVNPLTSSGLVDIQGARLERLAQVMKRQTLPIDITYGRLAARFSYRFAMVNMPKLPEPQPQASLANVSVTVTKLAGDLNPQSSLALAEANASLPSLDLALHQGGQIHLRGLDVSARQLALTQAGKPLLRLDHATAKDIEYDLAANQLNIADIQLKQGAISATRAKDGSLDWQRLTPAGDEATDATMEPAGEETQPFRFAIGSMHLQQWKASFEDQTFVHALRADIRDINLGLSVQDTGSGIAIAALDAELATVSLQSALYPQPVASLAKVSLADGRLSLQDSSVVLPAIRLSDLQTRVTVDARKSINWLAVLESVPAAQAPAEPSQPSAWKVALESLALENASVHIEDQSSGAPVALDVQNAMIELRDGSLDFAKPVPLKASFQLKQGGRFEADGKLALAPLMGDLNVKLSGLPLKPFSPYLSQFAMLQLADGQAGARGKLSLKSGKNLNGRFAGGFAIHNLAIVEETDGRPFLSWKTVSSDTLRLSFAPDKLHMDQLHIAHPVGRIIIFEDKTLNVQRMLRPQTAGAAPVQPAPAADANAPEKFPVTVDRLSVVDGDLEFADLSLVPQFGTHMHTLSGVVNGLSTAANRTAQVELDGKVDDYGSARIRGSIQPFKATDFTDLTLAFRNLEMNRLTPYSGKFAGRKIDSGKMSVDLEYKIKNRQLTGENKFVINTLKLGERVESPDAVDLPLDLAIALLQDSNGVIDLDLPISGSLDDPQFSYGKIVWKAIVNVISKVATAPFRALGKLLGISPEKLEAIVFDPGMAMLAPPEQEKLKAIADAMAKRPALTLRIVPAFDPGADKAALQELATRRDVLAEMGLALKEGEQPGPLDLNNVKVQSAITNLLKDRTGEKRNLKAFDAVKDFFRKPKPEDLPKYAAMLDQLEASAKVSDADLAALARARATAIQNHLVQTAGLEPGRVSLQEPDKAAGDGKTVPVRMELDVAKGKS